MSNKGLTSIIVVLVILCAATFGAFYLKIHPELAISQALFGKNTADNLATNTETNNQSPFGNSMADSQTYNPSGAVMENTVSGTVENPFGNQNGVTITPEGPTDETVIPNTATDTAPSSSTKPANTNSSGAPTQSTATVQLTQTLQKGSKGDEVKILQQFLIDNSYLTGKADGIFGPGTESAVKKFQVEYKLTADGIVGGKTRTTINELLAA